MLSGVPQCSVLGPLLFLIYINSLTYIPLSDSTRLTLYADDLLIYKAILTESSHLQLQGDINSIFTVALASPSQLSWLVL